MFLHLERGFGCVLLLSMENQPLGCCFDSFVLRLRLLVASVPDSLADEVQTSSHRQHRNDQQGDEEYFRHASLALLLDYIIRMFPAASNTWSSLLPNDFSSSRLPV